MIPAKTTTEPATTTAPLEDPLDAWDALEEIDVPEEAILAAPREDDGITAAWEPGLIRAPERVA
ncbi:MAG TPA: hypothetical protein VI997_07445 [Candidatus Thermoplasmatota archaeon]|nr:hypothetical protein [Candidatus Thermoplasmatota archaeon]